MMIEATDAGRLSRIVADAGDVVPVKKPSPTSAMTMPR
jgi:pyruvate/2-oxoglutarate dehydrogenase complex dihydrolipoamide acyltransferase (E2) component